MCKASFHFICTYTCRLVDQQIGRHHIEVIEHRTITKNQSILTITSTQRLNVCLFFCTKILFYNKHELYTSLEVSGHSILIHQEKLLEFFNLFYTIKATSSHLILWATSLEAIKFDSSKTSRRFHCACSLSARFHAALSHVLAGSDVIHQFDVTYV